MKRFISAVLVFGAFLVSLSAQAPITRFAVVDMNRIIQTYTAQMPEFKSFTEKRDRVQAEIEKQTTELKELNAKLAEAQESGNKTQVKNLETQIRTKTQAFQTYYKNNMAELEKESEQLMKNETLIRQITSVVRAVAETEGVSVVLDKGDSAMVWNSNSVDITSKVLERLRARR
ncbi:MAG: OmpH family outer membrane protein [Treponema sp.]|nr:OmpH family outer membrane protein [Treponema sp.]